jgi:energy-coupling factor transporter ATP-binding protein EcfA2
LKDDSLLVNLSHDFLKPLCVIKLQREKLQEGFKMNSLKEFILNNAVAIFGLVSIIFALFTVFYSRIIKRNEIKTRRELDALRYAIDRQSKEEETPAEKPSERKKDGQQLPAEALPELPDELVEACASGSCILFAGSGISAQAGYPTWREVLYRLIERASDKEISDVRPDVMSAFNAGKFTDVADLISRRLSREQLQAAAKELYGNPPDRLSPFFNSLRGIPFAGVLTTNWDSLPEVAFRNRNPLLILSSRSEMVEQLVREERFFIVKLYGDPNQPETFRFTSKEYSEDVSENDTYSKFLTSLFLSKTVFFAGTSLRGIDDFLSGLKLPERPTRLHYALVPRESDWALQEELFLGKYGVKLLSYEPTQGFPEVPAVIENLRVLVGKRLPTISKSAIKSATLNEVELENIGVFQKLTLNLNQNWNVLLGNNGGGKSTLLLAIALGLCGDAKEAAQAGERLLRSGTTSGSIKLRVGQDVYLTELSREQNKVRVKSRQLTALQTGNWVVLGFPPLRGISSRDPRGPSGQGSSTPVVEDLLPLLTGGVDLRLDDLKQWVVNVDAGSVKRDGVDSAQAERNRQLRDSFFKLLVQLTPGINIKFDHVDTTSWRVIVDTDDGLISLDQISQGMSSILGWVGTMLQRMYEIHSQSPKPELESALILVDEIDAHLHPEWQQLLVPLLKEKFPKLQIIATTHSPLLVAGMKASEVWVVSRDMDTKQVEVNHAPIEFEGMRADQILTSSVFGLTTTRSMDTKRDIDRYAELNGKSSSDLSEDEKTELGKLKAKLNKILQVRETPVARKVEVAVQQTLKEMARPRELVKATDEQQITPEVAIEIKRQLAEIFTSEESTSDSSRIYRTE